MLSQASGALRPCRNTRCDSGQAFPGSFPSLLLGNVTKGQGNLRRPPEQRILQLAGRVTSAISLLSPFLGFLGLPDPEWAETSRGLLSQLSVASCVGRRLRSSGARGCRPGSGHGVEGTVGAGPARRLLSASSSDIYRGRAVYILPVPALHLSPTCLNTEGARCLPSSSSSSQPHRHGKGAGRGSAPLRRQEQPG